MSLVALTTKFLRSLEVGPIPFPNSYFVFFDMNEFVLEKRPSLNGRIRDYSFREDVAEFLKFCMKSFEVVF